MSTDAEVAVLGGGPAGCAAALWCASLGLRTVLVEAEASFGGQLRAIPYALENVPGMVSVEGATLAETLRAQALASGAVLVGGVRATLDGDALRVRLGPGGDVLAPRAVVLATGVRRRRLGVPGEDLPGVAYNVGREPERLRGLDVVVVGGGDDAAEHARLAAPYARSVVVLHRRATLSARPALQAAVDAYGTVVRRPFTHVESIEGAGAVRSVRVRGPHGVEEIAADRVFVCAGPAPRSEGFGVACDGFGYVRVDRLGRTSRAGVWAAGDVCSAEAPTVAAALGAGSTVAKAIVAGGPWPVLGEAAALGTVGLRGLTLPARIGAYASERGITQSLRFDLDFDADTAAAARTDALDETVDYAAVAAVVEGVLARQHYALIETVAEVVASEVLARFASGRVRVRVSKPDVPTRGTTAVVEVRRSR